MEEKKFVEFKKEEFRVKEYVKRELGKGRISAVTIEYTPVGEKIIISTSKPGLIIGKRGEKIDELTNTLKKRFKLDNPHIDIKEIKEPRLDAQLVADEIALALERQGPTRYKTIAYKFIQEIMKAGALGVEILLSGKLPSERAKSWRFSQGYLKKTGNSAKVVSRGQSQAVTIPGVVGIQVSILTPDSIIHDRIIVDENLKNQLVSNSFPKETDISSKEEKKPKKKKEKK